MQVYLISNFEYSNQYVKLIIPPDESGGYTGFRSNSPLLLLRWEFSHEHDNSKIDQQFLLKFSGHVKDGQRETSILK